MRWYELMVPQLCCYIIITGTPRTFHAPISHSRCQAKLIVNIWKKTPKDRQASPGVVPRQKKKCISRLHLRKEFSVRVNPGRGRQSTLKRLCCRAVVARPAQGRGGMWAVRSPSKSFVSRIQGIMCVLNQGERMSPHLCSS